MILNGCLSEGGSEITEEIDACFELEKRVFDVGETVVFKNKSAGYTSVYWDFGDGNYSSKISPSHVYKIPGDYQPKLTIAGNNQNRTYKYKITITGEPVDESDSIETIADDGVASGPDIIIGEKPSSGSEENKVVTLSDKYVSVGSKVTCFSESGDTLIWDLGEDNIIHGTKGAVHYNNPGKKEITVYDKDRKTVVFSSAVQVYKSSISPVNADVGMPLKLEVESDFDIRWDMGDGRTSDKKLTEVGYDSPGNYTIKLLSLENDKVLEIKDVTISGKPLLIASDKIDQLLVRLANVGADRSQKDELSAELYSYCARGSNTAVGGMEAGTLNQLVIKLRIESTRYVRVNIVTDLVHNPSGKIERIDIVEYTRKDI
jgi:PKD repeat protein